MVVDHCLDHGELDGGFEAARFLGDLDYVGSETRAVAGCARNVLGEKVLETADVLDAVFVDPSSISTAPGGLGVGGPT